jgi:hypothetical protein
MGRHSFEYVLERTDKALGACNTLLAEGGPFMLGATPTSADLFLFGFLESVRIVVSTFVRWLHIRGTILSFVGLHSQHTVMRTSACWGELAQCVRVLCAMACTPAVCAGLPWISLCLNA